MFLNNVRLGTVAKDNRYDSERVNDFNISVIVIGLNDDPLICIGKKVILGHLHTIYLPLYQHIEGPGLE